MGTFAIHMTPSSTASFPSTGFTPLLIEPPADDKMTFLGCIASVDNPASEDVGLSWYFGDDQGSGGSSTSADLTAQPLAAGGSTFAGTILEYGSTDTAPTLGNRIAKKVFDARVGWEFWPTPFAQAETERGGLATDSNLVLRVERATITQGSLNVVAYVEVG